MDRGGNEWIGDIIQCRFMYDFFSEILSTITRNKSRSMLTAFGVFWGVFMLVALMGVGRGIRQGILYGTEGSEQNSAFFFNGPTSEPYMGFEEGRAWNYTEDDLAAIRHAYPDLKFVMPVMWGAYQETNNVVRGTKAGAFRVMGYTKEYTSIVPLKIIEGRFLNDFDEINARKVCVIGKRVRNDLFDAGEKAVGQLLRVNGIYYTVVGVVEQYTDNMNLFGRTEEMVMQPFSTVQQATNSGNKVHAICVSASEGSNISAISKEVEALLRQRNKISPTDKTAVSSYDIKEIFDMWNMLFLALDALIWIVGLGTLLSGVVGVSNIMLITVRERTAEIGIRRALGATPGAILRQVLSESLLLTMMAGMAGVVAAVVLLGLAENVLGATDMFIKHIQIDFATAVVAVTVITAAGLFAGYLPAKRALSIKAVEALYSE